MAAPRFRSGFIYNNLLSIFDYLRRIALICEAGDIGMKTELDPVDNAKLPNHDKREWRTPVLIKETTAITKSGKASNITEVNGPPNFGPPS